MQAHCLDREADNVGLNTTHAQDSCEYHPAWLDDGVLSGTNRDHLKRGLWALDTVNPNAWGGACEYLAMSSADVVFVQEALLRNGDAMRMR